MSYGYCHRQLKKRWTCQSNKSKLENISGSTIERLESYDKGEQIMVSLNKDHDIKDKYEDSDWIKTPLVIFLNNTYDLLIKKESYERIWI